MYLDDSTIQNRFPYLMPLLMYTIINACHSYSHGIQEFLIHQNRLNLPLQQLLRDWLGTAGFGDKTQQHGRDLK